MKGFRLVTYDQTQNDITRIIRPSDINLMPDYHIEVFAVGLNVPVGMVFTDDGGLYVAESGVDSKQPRVLLISNGNISVAAEYFSPPLTGINQIAGNVYVSHKGFITVIRPNGSRQDIISGLPSNGDFGTSNVTFGPDGKIYFGQGAATNSGVVGEDNHWVFTHPLMCDVMAMDLILVGQNYQTDNIFVPRRENAYTGAFAPFGVTNVPNEKRKGIAKSFSSILRANRDGTDLEVYAWGFRNPISMKFDRQFRLFAANRGYDVRGSRPIANAPDELQIVNPGVWYGWPDFCVGEPVTLPKYSPEGGPRPEFLLVNHPNIPPKPYAQFAPHTSVAGFDFNYDVNFSAYGDIFIAEYGSLGPITVGVSQPYEGIGHSVTKVNTNREVSTFASNKSGYLANINGEGGFGRLVDIAFGPEGDLYILDMGINYADNIDKFVPDTGMIWKIVRN